MPFDPKKTRQAIRDLGRHTPGPTEQDNLHLSVPMSHEGIHPLLTTKGDILTHTTSQTRMAVGSNFRALIAHSDAAEGLEWSDEFWLPNNFRVEQGVQHAGTGGATSWGGVSGSLSGTGARAQTADGRFLQATTAASTNSLAGVIVNDASSAVNTVRRDEFFWVFFRLRTGPSSTLIRRWVGVSSSSNALQEDNEAVHSAFFRFSTSAGDTNWQCVTNDGSGGGTVTDSGVVGAVDTAYEFAIDCTDTSQVVFWINGSKVATHTTDLPTTTQGMRPIIQAATLENAAKTILWSRVVIVLK